MDAATIRSVFGVDPPLSVLKNLLLDEEPKKKQRLFVKKESPLVRESSLSSTPTDMNSNDGYDSELRSERSGSSLREIAIMQGIKKSGRRLRKFRKIKRSGFDYIRKKKKPTKPEEENISVVKKKLVSSSSYNPMKIQY